MRRAGRWLLLGALALAPGTARAADAAPEPGIRYVYLVRHAHYVRDTSATDDRTGNGLDDRGHRQAQALAKRLTGLPVRFSRFVSSDLLRAVQTADDLGRELGRFAERDSLIAECTPQAENPANTRGQTAAETAACDTSLARAWRRYFTPSPGGDAHDLLVAHGNVIRWLVTRALGNAPTHWSRMELAHTSLTVIAVRPDGSTRLVLYSDASHLPPGEQTWTGKGAGWGAGGGGMR